MTEVIKFVGMPDGPKRFVDELGIEVGTFTAQPNSKVPCLNYHVPLKARGDFRPEELSNYDGEKTYRTNAFGRMLCYAVTAKETLCEKKAINRSWRCQLHGGRLHPLDQIEKEETNDGEPEALTRYKQYLAKMITVDDLDDEELAVGGFRGKNGVIYKPRNLPRELVEAFQKAIFERANTELRTLAVDAAKTLGSIMKNTSIEPDVRMKAALSVLERTLGKPAQTVNIGVDTKGFEQVFEGIFSGTRDESRRARGYVDGEVVGERRIDPASNEGSGSVPNYAEIATLATDSGSGSGSDGSSVAEIGPEFEQNSRSRLSERNEAILTKAVEIPPFNYDLTDHNEEVKLATKKRYAQDNGVQDWYIINRDENGYVTMDLPDKPKPSKKSADAKRKSFTLSDF